MNKLKLIQEAFDGRKMPAEILSSFQASSDERNDVLFLKGKHWSTITCAQLEEHHEMVFWLSGEAFCYYLPGIISAGIRENKSDLLVYDSIIRMLDRSPDPTLWDDFFLERWPKLTPKECEAVQEWVLWLSENENSQLYENTYDRALETLDFIKQGITAIKTRVD